MKQNRLGGGQVGNIRILEAVFVEVTIAIARALTRLKMKVK